MPNRRYVLLGAVLTTAVMAPVVVLEGRALAAHARLSDNDWMSSASREEIRDTAHQALGSWLGDPHDSFIMLIQVGDESSVPYVRDALDGAPQTDVVECTWNHGREALTKALRSPAGTDDSLARGDRAVSD